MDAANWYLPQDFNGSISAKYGLGFAVDFFAFSRSNPHRRYPGAGRYATFGQRGDRSYSHEPF